jgi:ankyrin repeat protein
MTKADELAAIVDEWYQDDCAQRLRACLEGGADPNARVDGATPLERLGGQGENKQLYEILLAAGADPKVPNAEGELPIHTSAAFGNVAPLTLMLDAGVPVDARDGEGKTPLHRAVSSGYDVDKVVEVLLGRGAPLDAKDKAGKRAVDVALGSWKKKLVAKMSKPVAESTKDLLSAIGGDDEDRVAHLLANGADPHAVDTSGDEWGPNDLDGIAGIHLCFARGIGRPVAEAVLAHPTLDVNVRAVDGRTPLHILMQFGRGPDRAELVEKLLARGADPRIANDDGETPLFETTSFYELTDEVALFDRLVAAGADPAHANANGETMLDNMWERAQRFHEQHDKAGFVTMMQKLVDAKVPSQYGKHVVKWLADKANPKAKKPKASKARKTFEAITEGDLADYAGRRTTLEIRGERRDVSLFDWFVLREEQDDDEHAKFDELVEYQIPPKAQKPVAKEKWIPFGVVGLIGDADTYQEIGVDGTLFLDLTEADGNDAPVVFVSAEYMGMRPSEPLKVKRVMYRALMATLRKPK